MLGFLLALVVFLLKVVGDTVAEAAFLSSVDFLYTWYWVTTILIFAIVGLFILVAGGFSALGGLVAGHEVTKSGIGSALGSLMGLILGSGAASMLFLKLFLKRALLILGAYILLNAGTADQTFSEFNSTKLIIGGIALFIGVIVLRRRSSSSSD